MPDLRSNRDLIVDKITSITADQIDRTLICYVHIGVLTLKLGLGDARPQQSLARKICWSFYSTCLLTGLRDQGGSYNGNPIHLDTLEDSLAAPHWRDGWKPCEKLKIKWRRDGWSYHAHQVFFYINRSANARYQQSTSKYSNRSWKHYGVNSNLVIGLKDVHGERRQMKGMKWCVFIRWVQQRAPIWPNQWWKVLRKLL